MRNELRRALLFTAVTLVLLGGGYNLFLWGVGRVAFLAQADGSLIRRPDGAVVGSRLIGQKFSRPEYFLPRPSGVDYNAASTGGTNYGPSNPDHLKAVQERLDAIVKQESTTADRVPSEMVTERRRARSAHPAGGGRTAGGARRDGSRRTGRARAGASQRAHRGPDVWLPRPRARQRARTEPGARCRVPPGKWQVTEQPNSQIAN
jgi:hypothetical protein